MGRNLVIGLGIALLVLGGVLFFLLGGGGDPHLSTDPTQQLRANNGDLADGADDGVAGSSDDAATSGLVVEVPTTPPLLIGHVIGEGKGIPGAWVFLFPVAEVEALLARAERMVGQEFGPVPNIPRVLEIVKGELLRFKNSAIQVVTDEEGTFEVHNVPYGGYLLLCYAQHWLFDYGEVASLEEGRTHEVTLELDRGASISGRVVRRDGTGVDGVKVLAEYSPPGQAAIGKIVRRLLKYVNGEFLKGPFEVSTDPSGAFEVTGLPPGTYNLVAYDDAGLEGTTRGVETGSTAAVIYFGEGATVSATLIDVQGQLITDTEVILEKVEELVELPLPVAGFNEVANAVNRFMEERPRVAVSNEGGYFSFDGLGAGRYRLLVEDPRVLSFAHNFDIDWGVNLDLHELVLNRGNVIVGYVRDEAGVGVAGARVGVEPEGNNFMGAGNDMKNFFLGRYQSESDSEGRFVLSGLGRGPFRVKAQMQGFAAATTSGVDPTREDLVELTLAKGLRLTGRVLDQAGEPLKEARVRVRQRMVLTNDEGQFVMDGITESDRDWAFREEGTEEKERPISVIVRAQGYMQETVSVLLSELPTSIETTLVSTPTIEGVVTDPSGKPVPGALVRLTPDFPREMGPMAFIDLDLIFLGVTVADLDGQFRFTEYFVGGRTDDYRVTADYKGYARGTSESFGLERFSTAAGEPLEVRLEPGGKIRGVVTDGRAPVSGAVVRLRQPTASAGAQEMMFMNMLGLPKGGKEVHTGSDGSFEYDLQLPGEYILQAEMVGFSESAEQTFILSAQQELEINLTIEPGRVISGTVTDDANAPLAGAVIRVLQDSKESGDLMDAQLMLGGSYKSAVTDEGGHYLVQGLKRGSYTLVAEKAGYARSRIDEVWASDETVQNFVMVPTAALRCFAIDSVTGDPVENYRLSVRSKDGPQSFWGMDARDVTDAEGMFFDSSLEPGVYDLELQSKGFAPTLVRVELDPGAVTQKEIVLERAAELVGVVLDAQDNQPIANARVSVVLGPTGDSSDAEAIRTEMMSFRDNQSAMTDAEGKFTLSGVPPGRPTIRVAHPEYVQKKETGFDVVFGRETAVEVRLSKGLELRGNVVNTDGSIAANRYLLLRGVGELAEVRKSTSCDEEGSYRFAGLEPGSYRIISSFRSQGADTTVEVEVRENVSGIQVTVADQ